MDKIGAALIVFLGVIALLFFIGLIVALPVMFLWNWLAPALFNLPTITFWQSYGLYILLHLLFPSSSRSK